MDFAARCPLFYGAGENIDCPKRQTAVDTDVRLSLVNLTPADIAGPRANSPDPGSRMFAEAIGSSSRQGRHPDHRPARVHRPVSGRTLRPNQSSCCVVCMPISRLGFLSRERIFRRLIDAVYKLPKSPEKTTNNLTRYTPTLPMLRSRNVEAYTFTTINQSKLPSDAKSIRPAQERRTVP